MIAQVARVDTQSHRLGWSLEPRRLIQAGRFYWKLPEMRELPDGANLGGIAPILEALGAFAAEPDPGVEAPAEIPARGHGEVG